MSQDLLPLLRDIAESHKSKWRGSFDAQLDRQLAGLRIGDEIAAIYHRVFCNFENPNSSRWYDPYHVLFSTGFALKLVQELRDSIPQVELVIPAILLHDVGYYAVQDKTLWDKKESRTVHMQEGAARAARILWQCGRRLEAEAVEAIVGMVAVHDNPYVGIPIGQAPLRQAVRDCDRVWVMHALSFYKDWHHKQEQYLARSEGIEDFLADRTVQFYGAQAPESLAGYIRRPPDALAEKNEREVEKPHFPLTVECVEGLIKRRWQEVNEVKKKAAGDVYRAFKQRQDYFAERIDGDFGLVDVP
jgi:hypothetical protein